MVTNAQVRLLRRKLVTFDGSLPIGKLRTDVIGFAGLNAGFDKLAAGEGVRQVLTFGR